MKILVKKNHKNHPPCTCICMETRPPTCLQSCGSPSLLLRRRVARKIENKASFLEVETVCWPSTDQRSLACCLLIRNAPIWIPKISHLFELLVALSLSKPNHEGCGFVCWPWQHGMTWVNQKYCCFLFCLVFFPQRGQSNNNY